MDSGLLALYSQHILKCVEPGTNLAANAHWQRKRQVVVLSLRGTIRLPTAQTATKCPFGLQYIFLMRLNAFKRIRKKTKPLDVSWTWYESDH